MRVAHNLVKDKVKLINFGTNLDDYPLALSTAMMTSIRKMEVSLFGKYLGILLGPGAAGREWDEAHAKFNKRLELLCSIGMAPISTMVSFNTYVRPVLSHVAQCIPPPRRCSSKRMPSLRGYSLLQRMQCRRSWLVQCKWLASRQTSASWTTTASLLVFGLG